ncbi:aliphatic sulfonate ABC transporter substrate-binding protein [Tatumella saanichensis]|uniref:aliphatic sulfonate ABC transporter substrate-binding protein n=1 Tax=Tatumella saanichensis TaxID=480813 RepID=UPI0004A394BE|nr:aliphatic sulfonate ABC transporter substrate-binding protein [Tatumella saanichensis]
MNTDIAELIDPASQALTQILDRLAPADATVLICGETGSGKEVVARYLHQHSPRRDRPFLAVNCGALSEQLAESELFGYEKGAFTGASQRHTGWFEAAEGGTLLLDEVGELSLALQVKLLRVLQEREITRVGSRQPVKINVRVIAATHVDLTTAIAERRFREDLYYRLNVASVSLPPLRQRPQDIPQLADHFLSRYSQQLNRPGIRLSEQALEKLCRHPWPGNVRELENVLYNTLLMTTGPRIEADDLSIKARQPLTAEETAATPAQHLQQLISVALQNGTPDLYQQVTDTLVRQALTLAGNNQSQAAALLGISRHTLRTHLARLGVIRPRRNPTPGLAIQPQTQPVIRIGYQRFGNLAVVKARQSLEQLFSAQGVSLRWSEFPAGPQMLLALNNGDIDFGSTGEVPPLFSQAGSDQAMYVGWQPAAPQSVALLVPQHSAIHTPADLQGKRIAVNKGSNVHYLLLQLLDETGLTAADVEVIYTTPGFPLSPSDQQAADAWMMWDPILSEAECSGQYRVIANGQGRVDNHHFYLAGREFVRRQPQWLTLLLAELKRAGEWIEAHPEESVQLLSGEHGLSCHTLRQALSRHCHQVFSMDNGIIRQQQVIADRFYALGLLPRAVRIRDAVWCRDKTH